MAKTKTTTRKFKIVDLVRYKPRSQYIVIDPTKVEIDITVETKGLLKAPDAPESAMKRLEDAARSKLEFYEKTITTEAQRLSDKIDALMKEPTKANLKAAEDMIATTNHAIKNALLSAQGAAEAEIAKTLKSEAQRDKNLKEARVRTGFKWTMGFVKIGGSVAKLVATSGADASSYLTIAKTLASLGADIAQQIKNEEKLRAELTDALKKFIELRGTAIQQAVDRQKFTDVSGLDVKKPKEAFAKIFSKLKKAKAETMDGKDPKARMASVMDFVTKTVKSKLADCEKKRKFYREHTTKTRHKVDALSVEAGKLQVAMKKSTNLKQGVLVGSQCMEIKRQVTAMAAKLKEREDFLAEMQDLMVANGLDIDDRTTLDKIRDLDKMTILKESKSLKDAVKAIGSTVSEIVKAAA